MKCSEDKFHYFHIWYDSNQTY